MYIDFALIDPRLLQQNPNPDASSNPSPQIIPAAQTLSEQEAALIEIERFTPGVGPSLLSNWRPTKTTPMPVSHARAIGLQNLYRAKPCHPDFEDSLRIANRKGTTRVRGKKASCVVTRLRIRSVVGNGTRANTARERGILPDAKLQKLEPVLPYDAKLYPHTASLAGVNFVRRNTSGRTPHDHLNNQRNLLIDRLLRVTRCYHYDCASCERFGKKMVEWGVNMKWMEDVVRRAYAKRKVRGEEVWNECKRCWEAGEKEKEEKEEG
ncbi:hypothetical protein K505DRAFT_343201 [Melanomma pulvis-pyrius CBS 109.77]|uniref:Uncharacterized protein n=1 Tax=Melanomma pulvis-pyrius CBS 109.77 TaxID=1314802 RepID=A0A6A6WTK6_9PLEO|nr:hypothetical protein K505DRAFT_343201 [Melanomma pulvis-pyrius CBS 109.77]